MLSLPSELVSKRLRVMEMMGGQCERGDHFAAVPPPPCFHVKVFGTDKESSVNNSIKKIILM